MLEAHGLLEALAKLEENDYCNSDCNTTESDDHDMDDYELGEVLAFCSQGSERKTHPLRYSDGSVRTFSFDDEYDNE